jgi:hypothetical protein
LGLRLLGPVAGLLVLLGWWFFRAYALDGGDEATRGSRPEDAR